MAEVLPDWRNQDIIIERARPHYRDLPYHNLEHGLETRDHVREIALEATAQNDPIDPDEVEDAETAAILHDAGFYIPVHRHGFRSKEVFSGYIAANILQPLGMPNQRIGRVVTFILGTELHVKPVGRGGKAVRKADIWGVAYDPPLKVIRRTVDLFEEDAVLKQKYDHPGEVRTDLRSFAQMSRQIIGTYNKDDVITGDYDVDKNGQSRFTNQIESKLPCFLMPQVEKILKQLGISSPKNPAA